MPRLQSRQQGPTRPVDANTKGGLAPDASVPVKLIMEESWACEMYYMCRAYSEENRPGFHPNEDRFFCEEHLKKDVKNARRGKDGQPQEYVDMFVVGVIDGHDGSLAWEMVGEQLPPIVFNSCFRDMSQVHEAHKVGFQEIENNLLQTKSTAGCCVNSVVCWGRYLHCANLGDCRWVFIPIPPHTAEEFNPGNFVWMSRDLKASMPYEQERIQKWGWRVVDGRVEGLEPTRTVGDFDIKEKVPKGVISIIPETRVCDIIAEGRKVNPDPMAKTHQGIIVQGTDGIWDVVVGQDIQNFLKIRGQALKGLQKYLENAKENFDAEAQIAAVLERIAQDIVTFAVTRGSSDDCTAIITMVSVEKERKTNAPPSKEQLPR